MSGAEVRRDERVTTSCVQQPFDDGFVVSLALESISMIDEGEIKVVAQNILGEVHSVCHLTVNCTSFISQFNCQNMFIN